MITSEIIRDNWGNLMIIIVLIMAITLLSIEVQIRKGIKQNKEIIDLLKKQINKDTN